jgi:hypothetical protein
MYAQQDDQMVESAEVRIVSLMLAVHAVVSVGLVCLWSIRHLYVYLFRGK